MIENDDPAGKASRGFGGEAPDDAKNPPRANLALDKAMLFATWLIPVLEGFPRSQRFLLGDRLQSNTLDIVEALIELRSFVGWISAAHPPPSDHDAASRRRCLPTWPGVGHLRASRRESDFVPAVGRCAG